MRRGAFPWSMACSVLVALACSGCGKVAGPQEGAAPEIDAGRDARVQSVDASARADASVHDAGLDARTPPVDAGVRRDTGSPTEASAPRDAAIPFDTGGPATCVPSCQTDTECQASCPAVFGSVQCCDTVTSACFESASTVCPDEGTRPNSCNGPCTTDSQCETLCTPPTGLVMCCDSASMCVPSTACPAPAGFCGDGFGGGFPCGWYPSADMMCASECGDAAVGSSYCCFGGSGACYLSPTAACP